MAKHSFSVPFPGSAQDIVAKAKAAIEKAGGQFSGNEGNGTFSVPTPAGTVKGSYAIAAQSFSVDITDKPFIVPGSAIESQVRKFLEKA
ncbi:hypothetical protein WME98_37220 [Sorangium sp. So ce296]|uniref:Uncharacterized protein n=2 Tax=Sorangium cellulosum TaxID=56 RepID=A0A150R7K3_SORCE|nr:hypothetical protein [Sorangium cellulosum]AGP35371.1 hypothetical protein SCE1572_13065 [Sorangium cellulosum So0157-2]KYF76264.1 hypothetical protein BE18_26070 [Sorangium cellulosum]KYF96647.1 hypothetical protein BE20_41390 [Sorangium cellulosum]KYG06035.1 hypothetical protein BE21_37165 [Sorangium cellulosum]